MCGTAAPCRIRRASTEDATRKVDAPLTVFIFSSLMRKARCGRKLGLLGGSSCIRTKSACAQSGSRSEAAFVEAIETVAGDAVSITWRYADKQGTPPNWAQLLEGHGIGSHYCCCSSVKFSTIFCGLQCWLECCAPSVFDFGRCHPSSAASGCRVDPKGLFSTFFGQNNSCSDQIKSKTDH